MTPAARSGPQEGRTRPKCSTSRPSWRTEADRWIKTGSTLLFIQFKPSSLCNSGVYLESFLARRPPDVFEGLVVLQQVLPTGDVHLQETNSDTPVIVKQGYIEFQRVDTERTDTLHSKVNGLNRLVIICD